MTLIDRAVMKAFERLEPAAGTSLKSKSVGNAVPSDESFKASKMDSNTTSSGRELFLHEPEIRLQGMHRVPNARHRWAFPQVPHEAQEEATQVDSDANEAQPSVAKSPPAVPGDRNVEPVINSLLNYELSIQGPRLEDWQITTQVPATETSDRAAPIDAANAAEAVEAEIEALNDTESPADLEPAAAPISVFKPAWETDAFLIPEICRRIQSTLQDLVQQAAARLIDDCIADRPLIRVNGVGRSVGQSTVSILVARALAKAGIRVLLIDGDISKADLSDQLGVAVGGGWHPSLSSLEELSECCVFSLSDKFCVLPFDAHEASQQDAMSMTPQLWQALAQHFDIMIVDAGMLSSRQMGLPDHLVGAHIIVTDARTNVSLPGNEFSDHNRAAMHIVENFASTAARLS